MPARTTTSRHWPRTHSNWIFRCSRLPWPIWTPRSPHPNSTPPCIDSVKWRFLFAARAMHPTLVFDIETIPDLAGFAAVNGIDEGALPQAELAEMALLARRQKTVSDFMPHHLL